MTLLPFVLVFKNPCQNTATLSRIILGKRENGDFPTGMQLRVTLGKRLDELIEFVCAEMVDIFKYRTETVCHDNPSCFDYTQYIRHSQCVEHDKLIVVMTLISYEPFYETLFRKNITEYNLIYKQGFSANTLYRIKKGKPISTKTLDALCDALDCRVEDVIRFIKE